MGSGKSTIGRRVAAALSRPFVDNDARLEQRSGVTAAVVSERDGVAELHRIEADVLLDALASQEPSVIAAAASTIEDARVRDALRDARVVWLRADPAVLAARLPSVTRPFGRARPGATRRRAGARPRSDVRGGGRRDVRHRNRCGRRRCRPGGRGGRRLTSTSTFTLRGEDREVCAGMIHGCSRSRPRPSPSPPVPSAALRCRRPRARPRSSTASARSATRAATPAGRSGATCGRTRPARAGA